MRALDTHAHPGTKVLIDGLKPYIEAMEKHYRMKLSIRTEEEMIKEYKEADVKVIFVAMDAETNTGLPRVSNDYIARLVKEYPEVIAAGYGSVDPWKGELAIQEAERAIKELGLIGLKFQQIMQGFFPNDRKFYPLWEKCVELKCSVQFHVGVTGMGSGLPGGMGLRLKYTHPMCLDDLAADFPDLKIIALHVAWPWQEEMLAVLQHKANVYNELSGWLPKYFPPSLKREIGGRLQDKFMFGSDYPAIMPTRWLNDFEKEGYKTEIMEKVFYKNAERILGIKARGQG